MWGGENIKEKKRKQSSTANKGEQESREDKETCNRKENRDTTGINGSS